MLEYEVWRDLVRKFVEVEAGREGFLLVKERRSRSSRSIYLEFRRGPARAEIRLSDHRPARAVACRWRLFSIRQAATSRLHGLAGWFRTLCV